MLSSIAISIVGMLVKFGFGNIVDKGFAHLERKADTLTEREKIRANMTIELARSAVAEVMAKEETKRHNATQGTERQKAKMNYPVFWVLIGCSLGPGIFNLIAIALYNVFWHQQGIWPQDWFIAEFPAQSAVWVDMSIRWLFDPYGFTISVGTATAAGKATAK